MKKQVAIIGGGACALMLACELDPAKFEVAIYEKNSALGRKFLVAGEGGLNLTHSEDPTHFITRYTPSLFLEKAFSYFSNKDFVVWLNALGIETYVGSSGRVFPKQGQKPIEVLTVVLDKIKKNKVKLHTKHALKEFKENELILESNGKQVHVKSDLVVFCIGGASWPVTGSVGDWTDLFKQRDVKINPFEASNCAFKVRWDEDFVSKIEGKILKNISISCDGKTHLGEVVLTRFGIEGSGIYPLSPQIRAQLNNQGRAELSIDFKPNMSLESVTEKLKSKPVNTNITAYLKNHLRLNDGQVFLLKEFLSKEIYLDVTLLSQHIKNFKLEISGIGPIEEAISTTGGIALEEIDNQFQLKKMPHHFVIGEMLDYDAPTGGYLLQSCFTMAKYLANHFNSTF